MNKKIIIVGVVILALSMLFVACKDPQAEVPTTTTTEALEITTAVDEKGPYVFNKKGEKVYLEDESGFIRTPEEAYNSSLEKQEEGFFVGNGEGSSDSVISWEEIQ